MNVDVDVDVERRGGFVVVVVVVFAIFGYQFLFLFSFFLFLMLECFVKWRGLGMEIVGKTGKGVPWKEIAPRLPTISTSADFL